MVHNDLIFDIGMHTGQDTKHYLKEGFKVIAVEANPFLCGENEIKFKKDIAAGKLVILNVGISDKRGVMPFYINKRLTEWSSFDKELGARGGGEHPYEVKEIECITTKDMIDGYGVPYYIKVDIEGFDFYVVDDLPADQKPPYFSCECSEVSLIDKLHKKGYTRFKLINQANNFKTIDVETEKKWYTPHYRHIYNGIKLKIQKVIDIEFPYSSAGPFAENTRGNWTSYEEARKQFLAFARPEMGAAVNNKSWFDIHAAL